MDNTYNFIFPVAWQAVVPELPKMLISSHAIANFSKIAALKGGFISHNFKTKSASSQYVAEYGIDKMLQGKKIIIPTIKIKLARFFCKFVPDILLAKFAYGVQKKRKK